MEFIASLIIAVMGGVICHYIIKWLDGDEKKWQSAYGVKPSHAKSRNRKPRSCRSGVFAPCPNGYIASLCLL